MSAEYNSKLIAKLYAAKDDDTASEISQEMADIKDPIFIQPLYAAYKRFRLEESYMAHYFLSNLKTFKTPETTEIFKEIALLDDTEEIDFSYAIEYLEGAEFSEPWLTEKALSFLIDELKSKYSDGYRLGGYLRYLVKAKPPIILTPLLKEAFEDNNRKKEVKEVALQFLLKENAKENLQYYFDNYEKIKGTSSEIVFAREISRWQNGIVPKLHEKIIKEGSSYAREIIETKIKKSQQELAEKEKNVEIKYNNAQIITEISQLRSKINTFTNGDSRFGFSIFPQNELIYQQTAGVEDRTKLVDYCMDLRSFIQKLNKEGMANHEYSTEQIKELIPGIENTSGSINLLHLFLLSRKIEVSEDIFGLRKLNKIVSKLAHPDEAKDLIFLLKENGLFDLYKEENFQALHRKLLEKYKGFLILFQESLKKTN